jgi:hypothetical protein
MLGGPGQIDGNIGWTKGTCLLDLAESQIGPFHAVQCWNGKSRSEFVQQFSALYAISISCGTTDSQICVKH